VSVDEKELKRRMARLGRVLADIPPAPNGFSVKSVREDREIR